jgi:hypothetical protein
MSKVKVEAGVCGFVTDIEALLGDSQKVTLKLKAIVRTWLTWRAITLNRKG